MHNCGWLFTPPREFVESVFIPSQEIANFSSSSSFEGTRKNISFAPRLPPTGAQLLARQLLGLQSSVLRLCAGLHRHSGADNRLLNATSCPISELARPVSYAGSGAIFRPLSTSAMASALPFRAAAQPECCGTPAILESGTASCAQPPTPAAARTDAEHKDHALLLGGTGPVSAVPKTQSYSNLLVITCNCRASSRRALLPGRHELTAAVPHTALRPSHHYLNPLSSRS